MAVWLRTPSCYPTLDGFTDDAPLGGSICERAYCSPERYCSTMAIDPALAALGEEKYVSLTTFRRSGDAVSTPVWIGRDGDALLVTTPRRSGKVKRLRNSGRVELRPCSFRGSVEEGVTPVAAVAQVRTDAAATEQLNAVFRRKYGLQFRIGSMVEGLGKSGSRKDRVVLRITAG